mmetsp:Transcript_1612/g.2706  ORF Transcript_1612/g.2706 Transcript_1612/m.2706 type:complete len:241 (+) Transcript_1612:85-807(+)
MASHQVGFVGAMPSVWTKASSAPVCASSASSFVRRPAAASVKVTTFHRKSTISMISSNELRPGTTIEIDGSVYKVLEFLHVKPGKGAAFVRTKLKNLSTGGNLEKTFRAGESVNAASLDKITMQHTYKEGDEFVFMNMESFEEERLSASQMGDTAKYIYEGLDCEVLKFGGKVLDVAIPGTMIFEVTETEPGVKGNTVQGGTKPATISTGAVIQVPLFITIGEKIKVDTKENKYLGRAQE